MKVKLIFINPAVTSFNDPDKAQTMVFDGYGSGIDSGDKATGKAFTAAVKYALFKGLRLQYSDDPDADASEDIESIIEESCEKKSHEAKPKTKKEEEPFASEAQLNYVKGLAVACEISDEDFKKKYGYLPYDPKMPMRKARELIEELKKLQEDKLPF